MQLTDINLSKLKANFLPLVYITGEELYAQKKVEQVKSINKSASKIIITGKVTGNRPYQVLVEIEKTFLGLKIKGTCSCSSRDHCSHVIALILTAVNNASAKKITLDVEEPLREKDYAVKQWLNVLKKASSKNSSMTEKRDEQHGIFYTLYLDSHDKFKINVGLSFAKYLKSGKIGAQKPFSKTAESQKKCLYSIDRELLAKLEVHQALSETPQYTHYKDVFLYGTLGEKLLSELIETGRCHWESTKNPPLTLGEKQTSEMRWVADSQGCQTLTCFVQNASLPIFFIQEAWGLNKNEWTLARIEMGVENEMAKKLLTAPKIFPEQAKEVEEFFSNNKKTLLVKTPQIYTFKKIDSIKPIPWLYLSSTSINMPSKSMWGVKKEDKPVGQVMFKYHSEFISWSDEKSFVNTLEGNDIVKIKRNEFAEKKHLEELVDLGPLPIELINELSNRNLEKLNYFLLDHKKCDPEKFNSKGIVKLREKGWMFEISEDYPYNIISETIDEWYSAIEENSGYDWFGLELGVMINGEKINLLPVLQKLIQRIKNNEVNISKEKFIAVKLADGRSIKLPADRVRSILNVLIELHDKESLNNEELLPLSHLQAARLLELENALGASKLRWFGGEKLRILGKKLTEFKGIETAKIPKEFKGTLRPYQLEGVSWMQFLREYELGGVLADDMGLGKTIQALAHISLEKSSGRMKTPSLVIAPTSLMFNWRMEAERFSPDLKVLVLHGSERKQKFDNLAHYDLILTTYPLIVRDKEILLKQQFHLLILDEAQCIKNSKNLASQIALQIKANHRLCLTGTPMENHLGELWSLFHFMMPGLLGDEKTFTRLFRTPIEKHADNERRLHLNKRIAPFLLRRTKDKVVKELPPKVEMLRHIELEGEQRDLYETIRLTMQKKVRDEISKLGLARSHIIILDALLKLRQVCCDPRLLKIETAKKELAKSAKLELLMTLIPELLEEGRRILLFSQFTEMLELIEHELKTKGITYVKLTGQTKDRETPVKSFQAGEIPLFLISLKAGGTGLNLTTADTVIHYDPWWNPAVENQATDRAHRIGQHKTVFVYKFVTKGTVEEKILDMQNNKRALMEGLFSDNTTQKFKLSDKDLQDLFEPLS